MIKEKLGRILSGIDPACVLLFHSNTNLTRIFVSTLHKCVTHFPRQFSFSQAIAQGHLLSSSVDPVFSRVVLLTKTF